MAFVHLEPSTSQFWMKNTLIPLLVAFVGQDGRIIALRDMTPCEVEPRPMYGVHDPFELAIEADPGMVRGARNEVGESVQHRVGDPP